jgi:hypothetical protein
MEKNLIMVKDDSGVTFDIPKIVKLCLGVDVVKGGDYTREWEVDGICFEFYGYGRNAVEMNFRDENGHRVSKRVMVKAMRIDADLLKAKFEELKELLKPVAELKRKADEHKQRLSDALSRVRDLFTNKQLHADVSRNTWGSNDPDNQYNVIFTVTEEQAKTLASLLPDKTT